MTILVLIFLFISGLLNGSMDALSFRFSASFFSKLDKYFWNPYYSWVNKYKDRDPTKGPAFPFSTNYLVGITDAWHLLKSFSITFIILAVIFADRIYNPFVDFIIYRSLYGLGFVIVYNGKQIYNWILTKKLYINTIAKKKKLWLKRLLIYLRIMTQNRLKL